MDIDAPDHPELAARDAAPGFLDQRIAGIGVGQGVEPAALLDGGGDAFRLRQIHRRRLVGHDVKAGLQGSPRRRGVQMVGRGDHQHIHPAMLVLQQSGEIVVSPDPEALGRAPPFGRILAESAADQLELAIQSGGGAVDGADEGPLRAAHHAIADFGHSKALKRRARPSGRLASLRLPSSARSLVVAPRSRSRAPFAGTSCLLTAGRGS